MTHEFRIDNTAIIYSNLMYILCCTYYGYQSGVSLPDLYLYCSSYLKLKNKYTWLGYEDIRSIIFIVLDVSSSYFLDEKKA